MGSYALAVHLETSQRSLGQSRGRTASPIGRTGALPHLAKRELSVHILPAVRLCKRYREHPPSERRRRQSTQRLVIYQGIQHYLVALHPLNDYLRNYSSHRQTDFIQQESQEL